MCVEGNMCIRVDVSEEARRGNQISWIWGFKAPQLHPVYVSVCLCVSLSVCRWAICRRFYHIGLRDWTWIIRFGSKHNSPLNHLAGPWTYNILSRSWVNKLQQPSTRLVCVCVCVICGFWGKPMSHPLGLPKPGKCVAPPPGSLKSLQCFWLPHTTSWRRSSFTCGDWQFQSLSDRHQ